MKTQLLDTAIKIFGIYTIYKFLQCLLDNIFLFGSSYFFSYSDNSETGLMFAMTIFRLLIMLGVGYWATFRTDTITKRILNPKLSLENLFHA